MSTRQLVPAFLVLMLVPACASNDPFTRIESTYDGMIDSICRSCPAAAGAATEAECRTSAEANNPFAGPEFECQHRAYNQYENELRPYYDCIANATSELDRCLRGAAATCPPDGAAVSACNDRLDTAIMACALPDSIAASMAVSACFTRP